MTEEQELGITIESDAVKISGSITMDIDRAQTEIEKVETTKFSELQKVAILGGGLQRANMYACFQKNYSSSPAVKQESVEPLITKRRGIGFTRKRASRRKR